MTEPNTANFVDYDGTEKEVPLNTVRDLIATLSTLNPDDSISIAVAPEFEIGYCILSIVTAAAGTDDGVSLCISSLSPIDAKAQFDELFDELFAEPDQR